jgi:hypothetical protein
MGAVRDVEAAVARFVFHPRDMQRLDLLTVPDRIDFHQTHTMEKRYELLSLKND